MSIASDEKRGLHLVSTENGAINSLSPHGLQSGEASSSISELDGHSSYPDLTTPQTPILRSPSETTRPTSSLAKATWTRFAIPTKNNSLSSGFPFHPRLYDLKITHDQWHDFTSSIVASAKLTPSEDYLAWTAGGTVSIVSAPLVFLAPFMGYLAGRSVHRKTVVKTVKEKLRPEGNLRDIIRHWNDTVFTQKGFQAWLELPADPNEVRKNYLIDESLKDKPIAQQKKVAKKTARRFRIILIPNDDAAAVEAQQHAENVADTAMPERRLIEAPNADHRDPTEVHGLTAEPPPYAAEAANEPVSPETFEMDIDSSLPVVHYDRPAGFTNS